MRLFALIKKEILAIKNDKKSMFVVIAPPLIQVLIFAFSATTEVKHISIAALDFDGSYQSRNLLENFKGSSYVKELINARNTDEAKSLLEIKKVIGYIVIPDNFSQNLGYPNSKIQLILDGRRSNTAQIAEGYVSQILTRFLNSQSKEGQAKIETNARFLYNQNLNNFWWIVPNLFGSITMLLAIILSALSIAREKETGTFEQILVSPLRPFEILLGKLIPGLVISIFVSSLILFIAIFGFKVPFLGSLILLYFGVAIFLFAISGVGLFISSLCRTQQQAILGSFIFLLPSFLLSGFATPVENMPLWLQPFTDFVPLKYYIMLIKGVFLKDISFIEAAPLLLKMFLFGIVSLTFALMLFKRKTG